MCNSCKNDEMNKSLQSFAVIAAAILFAAVVVKKFNA